MNLLSFSTWLALGDLTVPGLTSQESAALLLLAASLLVFRAFRERYLLIWTLGWLAYFVSRWTLAGASAPVPPYLTAISQAEFVLAVCLFAAAIFVYTHARGLLAPLLLITLTVMAFAVTRVWFWPESITLRVALEVAYRVVAVTAAFLLIRYRWAALGNWSLAAKRQHAAAPPPLGAVYFALARRVRPDDQPARRAKHVAAGIR